MPSKSAAPNAIDVCQVQLLMLAPRGALCSLKQAITAMHCPPVASHATPGSSKHRPRQLLPDQC